MLDSVQPATPQSKTNVEKKTIPTWAKFTVGGLGVGALGADMYLGHSKTVPNSILEQLEKLEQEVSKVSKGSDKKLLKAIQQAKADIQAVIGKKYSLMSKIGMSDIRVESENALKPLAELNIPNEDLKYFDLKPELKKLTALGKSSIGNAKTTTETIVNYLKTGLRDDKFMAMFLPILLFAKFYYSGNKEQP